MNNDFEEYLKNREKAIKDGSYDKIFDDLDFKNFELEKKRIMNCIDLNDKEKNKECEKIGKQFSEWLDKHPSYKGAINE